MDGDLPVAVLDPAIAERLGAELTARLSRWTAAKQLFRHPDVRPSDYARVQRIFDDGIVYQSSPRHLLGYIEEDGRWWRAAIKRTADGLFLSTYHRADAEEVSRMARRYIRLR